MLDRKIYLGDLTKCEPSLALCSCTVNWSGEENEAWRCWEWYREPGDVIARHNDIEETKAEDTKDEPLSDLSKEKDNTVSANNLAAPDAEAQNV